MNEETTLDYYNVKPLFKSWNQLSKKQKETCVKGFKCLLSPQKRIITKKITKDKNGTDIFTIWEDDEGNRMGEIWGVHLIMSKKGGRER